MTDATYVRTGTIPLNELTPFPGNAKRGEVPVILDSLRRNGQYRGLVVRQIPDGPLVVLAGNHTAQALDAHGRGPCTFTAVVEGQERPCGICHGKEWEPSARCEVILCDDTTARRINLVDNKAADLGTYDRDALAELLSYLEEDGYAGTGYTDTDVQLLINPPPLSLEELADAYGEPEDDDLWPVLKFRVSPQDRDAFLDLTVDCTDPSDDSARFRYLLNLARANVAPAPAS